MTRDEQIQLILNQHNDALEALRTASDAFAAVAAATRGALDALREANHAQGTAITAVIDGNRTALRMLRKGA